MKNWLAGRKTYLLAASALIGVIVAWSTGEVSTIDALTQSFVALQTVFIRLGIAKLAQ